MGRLRPFIIQRNRCRVLLISGAIIITQTCSCYTSSRCLVEFISPETTAYSTSRSSPRSGVL